jgi:hypothetical protein
MQLRGSATGKTWPGSFLFQEYASHPERYEPPLPLQERNVLLDLGSGTATHGIALATLLNRGDQVILTDLPEVVPLMQANIEANRAHLSFKADIQARALAWGSKADVEALPSRPTLITASDVVYFPALMPLLLRTHLDLITDETTPFVLAYKSRDLSKEEAFFHAFANWFAFEAVKRRSDGKRLGIEDESYVFVAYRKRESLEWEVPTSDDALMHGRVSPEFELMLLSEIEMD